MSDERETIEPVVTHTKMMEAFCDWWRSGSAVIPANDGMFGVLEEYRWIETGWRCLWDQWPSGRQRTPDMEDVMIARLTDAGCRALLEWMREAGK